MNPEHWVRTFPEGRCDYMSCHWTDVERGRVAPQKPGVLYHFVDLGQFWTYVGEDPSPKPSNEGWWRPALVLAIGLILCGVELILIWLMFEKAGLL